MAEAGPIPVMKTAEAIHRVQFILIDSNSCSARQLVASSSLLSRPDYEDVVIERSIAGVCGYPTCSNPLPPQRGHQARYRVSLRDHRVYELEETFKYCSEECLISSRTFSALLSEERVLEMVEAKVQHVLWLFEHGNGGDEGSVGEGDLVSNGLSIKEKELNGSREMSLGEMVGTESAIEGYVPLRDRVGDSGPNLVPQQISGKQKEGTGNSLTQYAGSLVEYDVESHPKTSSGANQQVSATMGEQLKEITISEKARAKKASSKTSKGKLKNKLDGNRSKDMNFTSDTIIRNKPKDQKSMSEMLVEQLEDMVLEENTSKSEIAPKQSKFKPKKKPANVTDTLVYSTSTIICSDEFDTVAGKTYSLTYERSSEVTARSVDGSVDENRNSKKSSNLSKPKSKKKSMHNNCNKVVDDTHAGIKGKGSPNGSLLPKVHLEEQDGGLLEVPSGKELAKNMLSMSSNEPVVIELDGKSTSLKSSLKTSGSKIGSHSVKWADEEKKGVFIDEKVVLLELAEENVGSSVRFTSAEACAAALTQAAEVVASGKAEVEDAVSEAGIVILPYTQSVQVERKKDEAFEFDQDITKWPKKTVLLDTDMFEVEDAWYDTPPEGFSLNLSPFATMWMALFGWITCSSLAYIYGCDDGSYEDFMEVNGMEYPRKVILRDGQSLEIRHTLDGFISRILPELAKDFRLPTPISTLEKFLGCMVDTMSFTCAIPSLKIRQWHVIVLLFLEALSVQRLPALAPLLICRDLQLKQVLNAARISIEEYESMRDHILPLGRTWNTTSSSVGSSTPLT